MKHAITLATPQFDGDQYHCFGAGRVTVLDGRHDARQLWLLFDDEVVIFRQPAPLRDLTTTASRETQRKTIEKRLKRRLSAPEHTQQPYIVEQGVDQHPLPIDKWQVPSKSMTARIRKAGYPCFERDTSGEVHALRHVRGMLNNSSMEVKEWVNRTCKGRVIFDGRAIFELADDAFLAIVSGNFLECE